MYGSGIYLDKKSACSRIHSAGPLFRAKAADKESMKRTDWVSSAFIFLIVAYLIAALVQALLPFSLNRLIGAAIIIVLGYDFITHLNRNRIIASCLICILALINIGIFTGNRVEEAEFYVYWIAALLTLLYVGSPDRIKSLQQVAVRNIGALRLILIGSAAFVGALLISKVGYESSWGGNLYFVGFCNEEHTMASVCCLIMTLSLLCMKANELIAPFAFGIVGVMSWALLETGARTFLIPAAVIWIVFAQSCVKGRWLRIVLYFVLGVSAVYVFMSSGMSTKFDYLSGIGSDNSLLNTLTSGRIGYWTTDLGEFYASGPVGWLLGNSAVSVYNINFATFNMRIWAHNDFVMLLCSVGLTGTLLYILALRAFFTCLAKQVGRLAFALVASFVLFPALINGFYSYQHLLYAAVFLICAVTWNRDLLCK